MKLRYNWALQSAHGIVLLSAAFALALTALVVNDLRREYVHEIQSSNAKTAALAKLLEEHARQSFRRVDLSLQAIRRDAEGQTSSGAIQQPRLRQSLRSRLLEDGLVDSFSILAADGRALATTLTDEAASKPGPVLPDYIAAHQSPTKQPLFVGAVVKAPGAGRWLIPVSIRIEGPDNAFQGVVLAMLYADYFQRYYDSVDTGTNGFVTLFTRDAWIAVRSPPIEKLLTQNWAASPMFKEHLPLDSFKTVRQVVVADGIERLYSYRALPDYPVVVSAGVSLTDALAPWRKRMWFESIALCIVLVGLKLATVQLVRQLRRNARTENELKLTALSVSKASLPIFWIAPDARILRVNQAACDLHGYTEAQLLRMAITDLDPDFPPERWPLHWAELRQKKRMCFETTQRNCSGTITPVEVDLNFVEFEGQEYNFAYIRDISSRKANEEQLVDAVNTARAASLSKSQFLANMSHEIRTPMNAILGMQNLLQATELTSRQRDYASKTEGAAKSLLGLLNDILDFSKVEAGKMTLESEPFHIDKLMRNLSVVLSANVGNKNIEVLFDVDPELPSVLCGDAIRLQQVLINLGGNAVKFTSEGQVVLSLRKLSQTEHTIAIRFAVQDTGIGIAPEHQTHIFTGFSQAEGSTTRRFGGTGLGLAISKRFVELMGGDIQITSEEGVGSTFAFTLELPTVDLSTEPQAASLPQRVLVVDDHAIASALTLRMVRSCGWSADLAKSGKEAIELLSAQCAAATAEFPYSVIYMDWQMPEMDGWETTRNIRELAKHHQLPQPTVIMLSAHGRDMLSHRTEAEQEQINGFLVKPATAAMLYDAWIDAQSGNAGIRKLAKGRSSTRQLSGMRILVVEDNLINQQVADELLSLEGAIVSLAANGQLGVDAVAAAAPQFDVVLMDVQMPVLDGYGATRSIREELKLKDLPIIAMTANAMASDREACLAAGMNEHIGKPFDMAKLVSLLIRTTGFHVDTALPDTPDAASRQASGSTSPTPNQPVPEVAGLDIQTALNRMSGMRSLYLRTAKDFVKILETAAPELQQCLVTGDKPQAMMRLHTLKGNAGTLGAMEMAAQAAALEKLCKTSAGMAECETALAQFAVLVRDTQGKMQEAIALFGAEDAPNRAARAETPFTGVVSDAARQSLQKIAALAKAADLEVLLEFAQARELLAEFPEAAMEALDEALQGLDLETAATICDRMLLSFNG
jgi:PAS domain S-box-containing protein